MGDTTERDRSLPQLTTLKERLAYLFETANIPDSQKSLRNVAAQIRETANNDATGQSEPMTYNYLASLLRGEQDNPSSKKIVALARFFNVPAGYLLGEFQSAEVAVLAAKARGLGQRDLRVVDNLMTSLLEPAKGDPADH